MASGRACEARRKVCGGLKEKRVILMTAPVLDTNRTSHSRTSFGVVLHPVISNHMLSGRNQDVLLPRRVDPLCKVRGRLRSSVFRTWSPGLTEDAAESLTLTQASQFRSTCVDVWCIYDAYTMVYGSIDLWGESFWDPNHASSALHGL